MASPSAHPLRQGVGLDRVHKPVSSDVAICERLQVVDDVVTALRSEQVGVPPLHLQVLLDRHLVPVEEYFKMQGRYSNLFRPKRRDDVIDHLQALADRNIARYGLVDTVEA